jgi:hypothetical protein
MSPAAEQRIIELLTWAIKRMDMREKNPEKWNRESAQRQKDDAKMYKYFTRPLEDSPSKPLTLPKNKKIRKPK